MGLAMGMFGAGALTGLVAYQLAPSTASGENQALASLNLPLPPFPSQLNGRPQLVPLPRDAEVWECEVVIVGGSLGGVAAASHSMQMGATTCLIESAPWIGGQISSQGVSALDESLRMRQRQTFSPSWLKLRELIEQQSVQLPEWSPGTQERSVTSINSCWVGTLCFPPIAGVKAIEQLLNQSAENAPDSRWEAAIAFKGASFDASGRILTAVHAVHRTPKDPKYRPQGRLSEELSDWYSWSETDTFMRQPIRLQAPTGKQMVVIDATDTGELVGWAQVPHRIGSESAATTGEINAAKFDNPDCTQAFTFPFAIAIRDDQGDSLATLSRLRPTFAPHEHLQKFDLEGFPMFSGKSLFHYRRLVSHTLNDPYYGSPVSGDISMINWNQGNDWNWMDPPLILQPEQLSTHGQYQNWMGGLSLSALQFAEDHALMFARWLLETQSSPQSPLSYLYGDDSPMGTLSGLSMVPYIREGRRILGLPAYGQEAFQIRENDLRYGFPSARDFSPTTVAVTHYAVDIHGCSYRNWFPSGDAVSAPAQEPKVRPLFIPLESLIPQGVDNLLVGGKALAATHIANAVTRVHYSEWQIGAAAGGTAGWLIKQKSAALAPADIAPGGHVSNLQQALIETGLRLDW